MTDSKNQFIHMLNCYSPQLVQTSSTSMAPEFHNWGVSILS